MLFSSCDKQKRTAKKLAGEWEIYSIKKTDPLGLTEYATCSGTMTFGSCEDHLAPCDYTMSLSFTYPSGSGTTIQNGTFEPVEKGDYMNVTTLNSDNVQTSVYNYRILTLTKTDLQIIFTDSANYIREYIFKRKN
jgi:hypothetical protein